MADEPDIRLIQELIDALESEDAFERRQAIESLALITLQRLDFRWTGSEPDRARAVERWRRWLNRERKRRKGRQVQATIQILSGGSIDKQALEQALKGLPPKQKQALIAQVLAKVTQGAAQGAGGHAPCDACAKRPATVKITSREADGSYGQRSLCEICAAST